MRILRNYFILLIIISVNSCSLFKDKQKSLYDYLNPIDYKTQNKYWPLSIGNYWKYEKYFIKGEDKHLEKSRFIFEITDTLHKKLLLGGKRQNCILFIMKVRDSKDDRYELSTNIILNTDKGMLLFEENNKKKTYYLQRFIPNNPSSSITDLVTEYNYEIQDINFKNKIENGLVITKNGVREKTVSDTFKITKDLYETYEYKENVGLIKSIYERKNTNIATKKITKENLEKMEKLKKKHYDYTIMFQLIEYKIK